MAKVSAKLTGGGIVGVIALIVLAMFIGNFIAMLVFGAALGYYSHTGPGFWQTLFTLWSIAIVGASFNGTKVSAKK